MRLTSDVTPEVRTEDVESTPFLSIKSADKVKCAPHVHLLNPRISLQIMETIQMLIDSLMERLGIE